MGDSSQARVHLWFHLSGFGILVPLGVLGVLAVPFRVRIRVHSRAFAVPHQVALTRPFAPVILSAAKNLSWSLKGMVHLWFRPLRIRVHSRAFAVPSSRREYSTYYTSDSAIFRPK